MSQRQRIAAFKDFGRAVVRGDDIHERTRPDAFNPAWPAAGRNQVIPVILVESRITLTVAVEKHPDRLSFDGEAARAEFLSVGLCELPLTAKDAAEADSLELFHGDPFDRMLLAHAKSERIKIVSHDRQFPQYGDFVISV